MAHTVNLMRRCWPDARKKHLCKSSALTGEVDNRTNRWHFGAEFTQQNKCYKYLDNISKYSTFAPH